MVIWIIGMSASGKTTIGKQLFEYLSNSEKKWVFLDGDTFRNILDEDLGHSIEDRRKNAYRISRFCEYLNANDINVIACVLSIFHDNQKYNRDRIEEYKEIYIDVSFEKLVMRDNKNLYKKALNGEIKNVVGVDIDFIPPYSPDLTIDNNEDNLVIQNILDQIVNSFKIPISKKYQYTTNNLLLSPQKYQYTKFEGKGFIEKYLHDRNDTIKYFMSRIDKIDAESIRQKINLEWLTSDDILNSKEYLQYLLSSNESVLLDNLERIKLLVKRFEVSKKIYSKYTYDDIKKMSVDECELDCYSLFSLVLQQYHKLVISKQFNAIVFNSILKLNDIISSVKHEHILIDELTLAVDSIKGELEIIKEYV